MMLRSVNRLVGALRAPSLARQRRNIARERAHLAELRATSADLISAQVARIAELEGQFLASVQRRYGTTSRAIAAAANRQSKSELLA